MSTFEITIQRKTGETWPVVVEQSASGVFLPVRKEGTLQLDREGLLLSQRDPKAYGTILGQAVFRDDVRDALVQAVTKSDDCLHVLLFVEDAELRTLRWERLCAPLDGRWDFLGLNQRVPFSLYLPSVTDQRFPPIGRRDLRALALVANPEGLDQYQLTPFDTAATVQNVRTALGSIPCEVLAAVEGAVGPPTLDALCQRITAEHYTLLHIVCHGQFKGGDTILYWAKADGTVEPVTGTRLLERLSRLRGARGLPQFAFLSACESAVAEAGEGLSGLAQRMVHERELGMPAVLAMTEKVTVETAHKLSAAFYARLREHGAVDLALSEACAGLADRHDIHVPALYSRLGGRPLFSDTLDRRLTTAEIEYGLTHAQELLSHRAPVLQAEFDRQVASLRRTLGAEPDGLSKEARREREDALDAVSNLCDEALDLSFSALALGQDPPTYDDRCPFRGLYPFRREDSEFFFGRESLVKKLEDQLAEHTFVAALGASGSGKSSLVLAGLVRALEVKDPALVVAYLRPGSDPLPALESSLQANPATSLVVVDQFEELFTLCTDDHRRRAFLYRLLNLPESMRVVLTMRADFWGECAPYRELRERMQLHQELIPPMDATELRRAMEEQAKRVGLRFEADLSNSILDEVQGEPGAMPLLQHALLELWKRRHGRWLRAGEYRAIGGVKQAIAKTAEDVYGSLSAAEQARVRDIVLRLTRLDIEAMPGEERRDTRQRVRLDDLVPAGTDAASTKLLVNRLADADARLIVTSVNPTTRQHEVEVSHEALIRYWPRLREWLDEDRNTLLLRDSVRRQAREWERNCQHEDLLLHRGARLEEAEALRTSRRFPLNDLEEAYVAACVALQKRERDAREAIRRRIIGGLALGLALTLVLSVFAVYGWWAADRANNASRLTSAGLAFDRGITNCAQGEVGIGLLWLGRALEQTPSTAEGRDLEALIRGNMALWQGHANALTMIFEHPRQVISVAFSPSGRQILTGSSDHLARLWDATTGKELGPPFQGHDGEVWAVAFSPDGNRVLTGSSDKTARLWDATSRRELRRFEGHTSAVWAAAFRPDNQQILTASNDGTARLWSVASGKQVWCLAMHDGPVWAAAYSPDGKLAVTGGADHTIRFWDIATGSAIGKPVVHPDEVYAVAVAANGTVLTGGSDGFGRLWNPQTGQQIGEALEHRDRIRAVAVSPDGNYLLTGSRDRSARLWDASTGKPVGQPLTHQDEVSAVAFRRDGSAVLTGSRDKTVRLWQKAAGSCCQMTLTHTEKNGTELLAEFAPDGRTILTRWSETAHAWDLATGKPRDPAIPNLEEHVPIAFSPDGRIVITEGTGRETRLWEAATGTSRGPEIPHEYRVKRVIFSPDGSRVLLISRDNVAQLLAVTTGRAIGEPLKHEGEVCAAFCPDGTKLVTATDRRAEDPRTGTVRLWDVDQGTITLRKTLFENGPAVHCVAWSPDGRILATGNIDGTAKLWTAGSYELRATLRHYSTLVAAVFSLDNQLVATASGDRTARVWDANTGKPLTPLMEHELPLRCVAFGPDGQTLLTGSVDKTARLWDAHSGMPIGPPLQHQGTVTSVAFGLDAATLLTGSEDSRVRLWRLPEATPGDAKQIIGRFELITGMELDPRGVIDYSGTLSWQRRRDQFGRNVNHSVSH